MKKVKSPTTPKYIINIGNCCFFADPHDLSSTSVFLITIMQYMLSYLFPHQSLYPISLSLSTPKYIMNTYCVSGSVVRHLGYITHCNKDSCLQRAYVPVGESNRSYYMWLHIYHKNTKLIIISNECKLCGMLEGDKCYGKKVEWCKGD